jgi:hypothetical protein
MNPFGFPRDILALPFNKPRFGKLPGLFPSPLPPPFISGIMPMRKGGIVKRKTRKGKKKM